MTCLDADDEIEPDGTVAALRSLESDASIGWVAGNRLLVRGEKTFHSNTLVVRTDLLRLLGGWPGLGACEDLLLALRLGEESAGLSIEEVLIHYRAWEGQTTRAPGFVAEQTLAYRFIEQSINLQRAVRGRSEVRAPEPLGGQGSIAAG